MIEKEFKVAIKTFEKALHAPKKNYTVPSMPKSSFAVKKPKK